MSHFKLQQWFWCDAFHSVKFILLHRYNGKMPGKKNLTYNNAAVCDKESAAGGISESEPIITYRETLKVINDLCKLLQVENINE